MLYKIVRWIARLAINSYFRKIIITGKKNIPAEGPIIFVANHPSAFMDPMVVAFSIDRTLHFLVAAEFFGVGIKSWIYQNYLNMIPVYRPTTLPGESYKNDSVFSRCIELLAQGKSILIFPEGNSVTEKRIRKLKTGVARMALGTKEVECSRQVKIIPVGLNYSNPHRFRSDLFINIGKPVSIEQYSMSKESVMALTDEVEKRLIETVHHIPDEELDSVVKKVELLFKRKFQLNGNKNAEFVHQQNVIDSVQKLSTHQPQVITDLESKLDNYLGKIRTAGISDWAIADLSIIVSVGEVIRLVLTAPFFLAGFAINSIPYYATVYFFRRLNLFPREGFPSPTRNVRSAFFGSIALGIGMVFFLCYYVILSVALALWMNAVWLGLLLWIVFYLTGLFALRYIGWWYAIRQKRKLRNLISQQQEVFTSLIVERQTLIKEIMTIIQ